VPRGRAPRVFVPVPSEALGHIDSILEAGGEPMVLGLPTDLPAGGVALRREWVVDLPAVVTPAKDPFGVALAALGLVSLTGYTTELVVELARTGRPRSRELVEGFSMANALRAGLAAGGGPELLVHLAAIAREAGVLGFPQMIRVLVPESPAVTRPNSLWFETHGPVGLFAYLDDALHDTPTVAGRLKEDLPPAPPAPEVVGPRLVFVRGRVSGTEVICRADGGVAEVAGDCRFYTSEEAAVGAVREGAIGPSDLLVVAGCGPRGGPGLLRLDHLGNALDEAGLSGVVPVLTDGLPPESVPGAWASLATPEAAAGGVIGRLQDGDLLRLNLAEGLIRTGVAAEEIQQREPFVAPPSPGFGYTARYARVALPALEGAGFG
jgi:dihydroxy-acid dehydratase